jgi:hypothetical protein
LLIQNLINHSGNYFRFMQKKLMNFLSFFSIGFCSFDRGQGAVDHHRAQALRGGHRASRGRTGEEDQRSAARLTDVMIFFLIFDENFCENIGVCLLKLLPFFEKIP